MNTVSRFEVHYDKDQLFIPASDCNCACPSALASPASVAITPTMLTQSHPLQQELSLSSEHTAVFVPSVSRVAVLNSAALQLLRRFRSPQPLAILSDGEIPTARLFFQLGLFKEYDQAPDPPLPADELIVWLHVTNACNLRCTYCYINKTDEAMSVETALAAVDTALRSARLHGYRRVMLKYAGGEASLNLPLVTTMHCYAQEQARHQEIELQGVALSNGVGLTRHKLQCIRDLGLRLMISLDGPREFHDAQRPRLGGQGSFISVIASIERARELGLNLTVSITVTGASVAGLPTIVAWLLEREIHFSLNFYRECDSSARFAELKLDEQRLISGMRTAYKVIEQHLPHYSLLGCLLDRTNLSAAHRHTCAVGENYLVIDQKGGVAKCQMEIERPITTIWDRDPLNTIRLDQVGVQNLPVEQKEGCRDCQWKYWCAGGCAVATFRATGRYDIQSPNCEIYKALYPEVIRLEGLRLLHRPS